MIEHKTKRVAKIDPRKQLFLDLYKDPASETFGNAYRTALKCGYSEAQINAGLDVLSKKSVKQIGSDAAHLYHLLIEKELIDNNEFTRKASKKYSEIMKLRFDKERSNLEDMPKYVRVPLFSILNEYADGAVKRIDGKWVETEINDNK